MSISPGVATPMAVMSFSFSFAAATAWRIVSHIVSRPASCPSSGRVSRTDGLGQRLARVVHDRRLHRRPADVQPDEIPLPRHEPTPADDGSGPNM